jgi:predicted Zn-dependent protease
VRADRASLVSEETVAQLGGQTWAMTQQQMPISRDVAARLEVAVAFGPVRPCGRAQELEADRLGPFAMAKAGYDPREAAALWRRMEERGGGPPAILSTHPAPRDRIQAREAMIPVVTRAAKAT